jgi:hypothetical protein
MAREDRLVQNQENFRYANVKLGELVTRADLDGEVISFLCECADEYCLGRIKLTLADYDAAHLLSDSYVILHDHPLLENEDIAEDRGGYEIVQKG